MNPANITRNFMREQEARSVALGVVAQRSPSPATLPKTELLQYLTYVIPAQANNVAGSVVIGVPGDYLYIDKLFIQGTTTDLPADSLQFKTNRSESLISLPFARVGYTFQTQFSFIEIRNTNTVSNAQISLWIGSGYVQDNRLATDTNAASAALFATVSLFQMTFFRPNNVVPYAAGNSVNSNPAVVHPFTNVNGGSTQVSRLAGGTVMIRSAQMIKQSSVVTANAAFRLWLVQNTATAFTIADQAAFAFQTPANQQLQTIEFPVFVSAGGATTGAVCRVDGLAIPFTADTADTRMWGNLEARAAYIPTAQETFEVQLLCERMN